MSRRRHQSPDDTDQQDQFLSRWSKRKEQSRSVSVPPEIETDLTDETESIDSDIGADIDGIEDDLPAKADKDMPPIDSISDKSDVSEFFSPGVSETLRKAALRKLFHLPAFNIVDGLDDYDDDFTTFEALGDIVTADMRHQEELAKERELEEKQAEMSADQEVAESQTEDEDSKPVDEVQTEDEPTEPASEISSQDETETEDTVKSV